MSSTIATKTNTTSDLWKDTLSDPYGLAQILKFTAKNPALDIGDLEAAFFAFSGRPYQIARSGDSMEMRVPRQWHSDVPYSAITNVSDSKRIAETQDVLAHMAFLEDLRAAEAESNIPLIPHGAAVTADLALECRGWSAIPDLTQRLELSYVCVSRAFGEMSPGAAEDFFGAIRRQASACAVCV